MLQKKKSIFGLNRLELIIIWCNKNHKKWIKTSRTDRQTEKKNVKTHWKYANHIKTLGVLIKRAKEIRLSWSEMNGLSSIDPRTPVQRFFLSSRYNYLRRFHRLLFCDSSSSTSKQIKTMAFTFLLVDPINFCLRTFLFTRLEFLIWRD